MSWSAMTEDLKSKNEILELVGAIVLCTQEAEHWLKAILPFTDSQDPSFTAALARHKKLKRRSLGELMDKFMSSSTDQSFDAAEHLKALVNRRNQIVHHFVETFGPDLRAGKRALVKTELRTHLANIEGLSKGLEETAFALFEAMAEYFADDSPEYRELAERCARYRMLKDTDLTAK